MENRAGYKKTELGWIPDEWDNDILKSFSKLITKGTTPTTLGFIYQNQGINFIKVESIDNYGLFLPKLFAHISKETNLALKRSILYENDLLFSIAGALGRVALVTKAILPANTNQALAIIRLKDNINIHLEYLYVFLKSEIIKAYIYKNCVQSAQANLSLNDIGKLPILLPPLPEQQKIASILTTVDDKISSIEAQIQQTEQLKKGLMAKLLTEGIGHTEFKDTEIGRIPKAWEVVKLEDISDKVGSGITPRGGSEVYLDSGIPFFRSQNILHGKISIKDIVYISENQHQKMKNTQLQPHDVLLNITGASIGRCCIFPSYLKNGNVNQHVCIIRPKYTIKSQYLCNILNSDIGQKQIWNFQAGGNREGLNFQQIKSFNIPLPPLQEQQKIASILSSVDDKLDVLQSKKTSYSTLKKGLMAKLLTGQMRVKI